MKLNIYEVSKQCILSIILSLLMWCASEINTSILRSFSIFLSLLLTFEGREKLHFNFHPESSSPKVSSKLFFVLFTLIGQTIWRALEGTWGLLGCDGQWWIDTYPVTEDNGYARENEHHFNSSQFGCSYVVRDCLVGCWLEVWGGI